MSISRLDDLTVLRNYPHNGKVYHFFAMEREDGSRYWVPTVEVTGTYFKFITEAEFASLDEAINHVKRYF